MTPRLILASSSPRRRDLLAQIGVIPDDIRSPDIDEVPRKGELPRPYAERMASEKALAVPRSRDEVILAGDTTVAVGRRILPQAATEADIGRFLRLLSGRRHRVYSCISVIDASGTQRTRCAASQVRFKQLSDEEIAAYAATDLLCYRIDSPEELAARQVSAWQPLLDWAAERYGAKLRVTQSITPIAQDEAALAVIRDEVAARDEYALSGLHSLTTASASIVLALAVSEGHIGANDAAAASLFFSTNRSSCSAK